MRTLTPLVAAVALLGVSTQSTAQSLPTCEDVAGKVIGALKARPAELAKSLMGFEGACVRGTVNCLIPSGPMLNILTTCIDLPVTVQSSIASAMQAITGQRETQVKSFVSRCIAAGKARKQFPTDEEAGRNTIICYDFDNSYLEFRAEPK
jgi:hypothetical protein